MIDEIKGLSSRKISEETCRKYGYGVSDGTQVAPFHDKDGNVVAQKLRYRDKTFSVRGKMPGTLFGQHLFKSGGKRVVVTEGEIDAMSVYEVFSTKFQNPVVSLPNGAAAAAKSFSDNIEWLESFDQVLICFDMDEPGKKAALAAAQVLSPGKAFLVQLPDKDPSDCLQKGKVTELVQALYSAKEYRPDGVVNAKDLRDKVKQRTRRGLSYPWPKLDEITYGQHEGRLVTWTAGSGLGKSEFVRTVAYCLGVHHGTRVGYIALEENVAFTATKFVGLHLRKPIHLPDVEVTEDEIDNAFDAVLADGKFWFYDHFGSLETDALFAKMKYMAAQGCRFIVLDHLTIVMSGMDIDNERQAIDITMTKLRQFAEQTGVGIHLVCHLKRPEGKGHEDGARPTLAQLRGSASIVQLSDFVFALQRNSSSPDPVERNRTVVWVLKNRLSGDTGIGTAVRYDKETGTLEEVEWTVEGEDIVFTSDGDRDEDY